LPDRAEMNSAIVRRCKRVVRLRTLNERLNGGVPMPAASIYLPLGDTRSRR